MKNYLLVFALVFGLLFFGCTAAEPESTATPVENPPVEPATPAEEPTAPAEEPAEEPTAPLGSDTDEHGCIGSAGYVWCESLHECVRPWETDCPTSLIKEVAESFCGKENVDKVYVCGDSIRVVSTLIGGGSTIYDASGHEIATCPVVGPDAMSEVCRQYLMGNNCIEEEVC